MKFFADLHVHSHYSRATSASLNLEGCYQWSRVKGLNVVGTGDFTHPQWFKELREKLEPDGNGFFRLKAPPKEAPLPGMRTLDVDVRHCLTAEISSIYKQGGRVRKIHNVVIARDFDTVARINARLSRIGNLAADGRPILGLPARDLLEIVLECGDAAHLIPAHIWTPWFSMLGSMSGFDSVVECFGDLSGHIFALETGLSSDPEMNWRIGALDPYTLISNSDAHSPQKLGRESNLFDTELGYDAMVQALKTRKGFLGTVEFFPEEGKYHLDGHRKCGVCFEPEETLAHKGLCPACGRPLTVGVMHRVGVLADRKKPQRPAGAPGCRYLIPLPEVISEIAGLGPASKPVIQNYCAIISAFGSEYQFLNDVPIEDIRSKCGPVVGEAIFRMREERVSPDPGYDGEYGVIRIFNEGEIEALSGQMSLFGGLSSGPLPKRRSKRAKLTAPARLPAVADTPAAGLNVEQQSATGSLIGATLVSAGPGTGKTRTLVEWIANAVEKTQLPPESILAVTFTHRAADEMRERLFTRIGPRARKIRLGTFHAVCYGWLKETRPGLSRIFDDASRLTALAILFPSLSREESAGLSQSLRRFFETGEEETPELLEKAKAYRRFLTEQNAVDVSDLVGQLVFSWENEASALEKARGRFSHICVDEFQDVNHYQYRFLTLLGKGKTLLAIGDADQAIYGFRGSDVRLFFKFKQEFRAREAALTLNYRSSGNIVAAAAGVITRNSLRSGVVLATEKGPGEKIKVLSAAGPRNEGEYVIAEIEKCVGGLQHHEMDASSGNTAGRFSFNDIAVLFRIRAVGRMLLPHFKRAGIPVKFADGSAFLSAPPFHPLPHFFGLLKNPDDPVFLSALENTGAPVDNLAEVIGKFREAARSGGVLKALEWLFSQWLPMDREDAEVEAKKEVLLDFARGWRGEIADFGTELQLNPYTDGGRARAEGVSLLTFHASKGLEFPVVFIAGATEGITPSSREDENLEEERRLFYVAVTRAKEELHLVYTGGKPSPFIREIPPELLEKAAFRKKPQRERPEQLALF